MEDKQSQSRGIKEHKGNEEAIGLNKSLLEAVFSSMNEAIVITGTDGNIVDFNEAFAHLCRFKNKEETLRSIDSFATIIKAYYLDGTPLPVEEWATVKALKGESGTNFEYLIERTDINERWFVSTSYAPLSNDKGEIIGAIQTLTDITEHKEAEEALMESEEKYRTLFENAEYGFVVVEPLFDEDERVNDLRYLEINPAFERQTGLKATDFLGKRLREMLPGIEPHWLNEFDKVVKSGKATSYEDYNQDTGRWYEVVIFPYSNELLGEQFIDITERKNAEADLKESEVRFRSLYESSFDAILLTKPEGSVLAANSAAQKMFNRSEEELIKTHPDDFAVMDENLKRFLKDRKEKGKSSSELTFIRKDGTTFPGEISSSLFTDAKGNTLASSFIRDLTERKNAEMKTKRILDSIAESYVEYDNDWRYIDVNSKFEEIFGLKKEEIIGKVVWEVLPQTVDTLQYKELHRAKKENIHVRFETKSAVTGEWFETNAFPHPDGLTVYLHNITERKKAEEDLKASESKYRGLFDSMAEGVQICELVFDDNGRPVDNIILDVNPVYEKQTGIKREDIIGKHVKEIQPTVEQIWFDRYGEVVREGKIIQFEEYNAGTDRWYDVNATPLKGNQFTVIFSDITERKKAEEELRVSEERQSFLLRLGDVLGNLKDPDEIAAVASRMLGEEIHADRIPYARVVDEKEVIITGDYVNGVPSIAGVLHASDFSPMIIDAYKHNQWVIFSDISTDPRFTPAEREAYKAINVISNASIGLVRNGKWVAAFGAHSAKPRVWTEFELNIIKETGQRMWEAIERAHAEEEIKRRNELLNGINKVFQESLTSETEEEVAGKCLEVAEELTGSGFGFLGEINENGRLDDLALSPPSWNACRAPPGKAHELIVNMEIVSYWGRTIKEEKSQIVNDPENDPDRRGIPEGHPPVTSFLGVPLKQGGKTIGMIGLANKKTDYTAEDMENIESLSLAFVEALMRKRAEIEVMKSHDNLELKVEERTVELEEMNINLKENELMLKDAIAELKRSNSELQSFAYITSHDLQEPLRTIASFTQLLERRYKGKFDNDADEFMDYIVDAAVRMKAQIQGLLEYSRIDRTGEEFVETDMNIMVENAKTNLLSIIEESQAEITHDNLPVIHAGPNQMERVLQNLIGNSIKFKKPQFPPRIHISAKKQDKEWVFSVEDNGIGMDPQYSHKIFEVFKQLHTRDEYDGTGIGLSIVKKIIESNGGRIWVKSELGAGSTFYFTIPVESVQMGGGDS